MNEPRRQLHGVSADTLQRVEAACHAAGGGSWAATVEACRSGMLHRVEFAVRRPVDFVKEFAALVRQAGLKLAADSTLELFLGMPAALECLSLPQWSSGVACKIRTLRDLGFVEETDTTMPALSAVPRSAGITHIRRAQHRPLANMRVLILDDDAVSLKVLSAALQREGCEIRAAAEAEAAFGLLRASTPDVIILDIVLGGTMDGFDVCTAMRANPAFAAIPVLFVTGHPAEAFRLRAQHMTQTRYFEKPLSPIRLRDEVLALSRHGALKRD
ncbi:response regulator (plasmid) [Paraburkholderia sp. PREW-6R]|uniref:response regulator n=1 Tax=Paraburkholderia sp. PREW-6R TaxID=3141544 RepID=UPI0031F50D0B